MMLCSSMLQVYSMDCEMCYTTLGLQLTRVTVINKDLKSVFESIVKPSHTIVDYNTRYCTCVSCLGTLLAKM